MLSLVRDTKLDPPGLVVFCLDGFLDEFGAVFQGVERGMGFIAFLAELFLHLVQFSGKCLKAPAIVLNFQHGGFVNT